MPFPEFDFTTLPVGGSSPLKSYSFASPSLSAAPEQDSEKPVQFRLNQTGNIFYSTSSPELNEKTRNLFDSVTVLFSAMTVAMSRNNKDLSNYEGWGKVIRGSGFFVEVQKFRKTFSIEKSDASISTQLLGQLLPGLIAGPSMETAKGVLGALSGDFSKSTTTEETELAHLLFICEELLGAPSITVRLFHASKKSHQTIIETPCHKSSTMTFDMTQDADTFLFVSPDTIAEFAKKFVEHPAEYEKLIKKLSDLVEPTK